MFIQARLFWSLAIAFVVAASPAQAFRACTSVSNTAPSGHWPDPRNTAHFGTQKWDFDWRVDQEGLEVSNVRYTSDLSHPKKLVMARASLPFLPIHYPPSAPDCQDRNPHGYTDRLAFFEIDSSPFCCDHVPTTLCNLPDRPRKCDPATPEVSSCPASAISCSGVCVGTREVVSGASNADILLSTTFRIAGYVFVQRWRFQDNGTVRPSLRAGGVHNCSWHNHQIYWRFHFQLADGAPPKSVIQQCDGGGCADMGAAGWSANLPCSCGNRPGGGKSWWRFSDSNVAGRAVILQTNPTEGDPSGFCENAPPYCGAPGSCVNGRDFCALGAGEPHETFVPDNCNDHLPDQLAQPACANPQIGADTAFWYFAHINHHDPCTYLPICDPALGTLAFGPTIRLVGNW